MSTPTNPNPDPTSSTSSPSSARHKRSTSHSRSRTSPPPVPTTPLRPPSRTSLRSSQTPTHIPGRSSTTNPINSLEPAFAELSDSMADLEANFVHLQLMHESLSRFNECFASFLYGLNVNAFCVDFPEAPVGESFRRARSDPSLQRRGTDGAEDMFRRSSNAREGVAGDFDQTFATTDTSFVDNPPASSAKPSATRDTSRFSTPGRKTTGAPAARGERGAAAAAGTTRGGVAGQRGRPSGLARATGRGRGGLGR